MIYTCIYAYLLKCVLQNLRSHKLPDIAVKQWMNFALMFPFLEF